MTEEEKVQLQSALNKPYVRQLIKEVREQIQEDIRSYVEAQFAYDDESGEAQELCDHLCQIVVDNFKFLEKE